MLNVLKIAWAKEPARIVAGLAAVVVFVAARAGVVIDSQDLTDALLLVLPILLGGEATRRRVSPAQTPLTELPAQDEVQVRP